jgi:MoxR-like ATPase
MNQNDMLAKVRTLRDDLATSLLERGTVIEAALLALLTGEHLLLLGPPGTAKSLLVRSLCQRVKGATYFERLLTRFSTPEELFGPLSLSALEQDQYRRITTGTLVEAHIAFLDEVYKANSAILNSLLGRHCPFRSSPFSPRRTRPQRTRASPPSTTVSCSGWWSRLWLMTRA